MTSADIDPNLLQQLQRLADANIEIVPVMEITRHFVLGRGGYAALVERLPGGFGAIGTPGLVTERGFRALLWRQDRAFFVGRGEELEASAEQVEALRAFDRDLREALSC